MEEAVLDVVDCIEVRVDCIEVRVDTVARAGLALDTVVVLQDKEQNAAVDTEDTEDNGRSYTIPNPQISNQRNLVQNVDRLSIQAYGLRPLLRVLHLDVYGHDAFRD